MEELKKGIRKRMLSSARSIINDIAESLMDDGYPEGKKFPFKGTTVSKVDYPKLWWELDEDTRVPILCSTLVVDGETAKTLYVKDMLNIQFLTDLVQSAQDANELYKRYKEVTDWIANGGKCIYRSGWGWKGAGAREITKEKATSLLPSYSFGNGFYQLGWITIGGQKCLEFNELSENDLW